MPSDPPLTDEEICWKFEITRDDPSFSASKALSRSRPDRTICEVPECKCPHCGCEFTATWYDLTADNHQPYDPINCETCDRIMYVEHITDPEDEDYDGTIYVTLNTDPEPSA